MRGEELEDRIEMFRRTMAIPIPLVEEDRARWRMERARADKSLPQAEYALSNLRHWVERSNVPNPAPAPVVESRWNNVYH